MTGVTASICIRAWRRDTLPRAIDSVLSQGRDDIELIVGDDGADVEDIVEHYTGDPRVRYRKSTSRMSISGHARALLAEARGRYIKLLDDDDRLLPGYLDRTIAVLDADPEVGIVFTSSFHESGGRIHSRPFDLADGRFDDFLPVVLIGCSITPSSALIRRECWEDGERRHPLREDTSADMTMWMRAAEAGWPVHHIADRLIVYALHGGQAALMERERDRAVRLWTTFRFDGDPRSERLRRDRLAESLLARAHVHLRARRFRAAGRDIRAARAVGTGRFGERELMAITGARQSALRLLATHPRLVAPAYSAWRVLMRYDRFA